MSRGWLVIAFLAGVFGTLAWAVWLALHTTDVAPTLTPEHRRALDAYDPFMARARSDASSWGERWGR